MIRLEVMHESMMALHMVRFPPGLQAALDGTALVLSGRAGTVRLHLPLLDPVGLAAFKLLGMDRQGDQAAGGREWYCVLLHGCADAWHLPDGSGAVSCRPFVVTLFLTKTGVLVLEMRLSFTPRKA
eukprot:scaffold143528_cov20-Tisochrysis_lutea.AAC.1